LVSSDTAFQQGDVESAVTHTLAFAEIVFAIQPFVPEEPSTDWKGITKRWILGHSLADIAGGIESEVVEFLETALVYRLVWALEAVRVRAIASAELDETSFNGYTAMAVETGTHVYAASLLIHCGLASRAAAIKAVQDERGEFTDVRGMRQWIFSVGVKRRTQEPNWPTPQTASLWKEFVQGLSRQSLDKWEERHFDAVVDWRREPLRVGSPVRIRDRKFVFSVDWNPVGVLRQELSGNDGIFLAHVGGTGTTITGQYLGPRE